jgi:hypothetical protein
MIHRIWPFQRINVTVGTFSLVFRLCLVVISNMKKKRKQLNMGSSEAFGHTRKYLVYKMILP